MENEALVAGEDAKRADQYLAQVTELSRTEAARLLEDGSILINGTTASKKQPVRQGDVIELPQRQLRLPEITPEDIPLDIVYQDRDIAVINKPRGMVVHPAHGNYTGTLVHAILYHIRDLSGINGELRPGIVHRLDKNTSGLIIIAKNDRAHASLAQQFQDRTCEKIYLAIAEGVFKEQTFQVEAPIGRSTRDRKKMTVCAGGRYACTGFEVLEQFTDAALLACTLHTGRTHQIRVHLEHIGHPCIGDPEYGFKKQKYAFTGQALHSWRLTIRHPATGENMRFEAPLPTEMQTLLDKLRN